MYQDDYPSPPSSAGSSYLASSTIFRHSITHLYSAPLSTAYGQRASKASDIAHLLDPSYSPTGVHHDDNQIYIDHAGEVHDPDFRLFALAPKRVSVPDLDSDDDDAADEAASLYSAHRQPRRASLDSYPARPSSRASRYTAYSYAASAPARPRAAATHEPAYVPFAYGAEPGYASDGAAPRRAPNKLRRRRASCDADADDDDDARPLPSQPARAERTPSCAHALRRQWLALCLRTQVAAFRARRRVARAVARPRAAAAG